MKVKHICKHRQTYVTTLVKKREGYVSICNKHMQIPNINVSSSVSTVKPITTLLFFAGNKTHIGERNVKHGWNAEKCSILDCEVGL